MEGLLHCLKQIKYNHLVDLKVSLKCYICLGLYAFISPSCYEKREKYGFEVLNLLPLDVFLELWYSSIGGASAWQS